MTNSPYSTEALRTRAAANLGGLSRAAGYLLDLSDEALRERAAAEAHTRVNYLGGRYADHVRTVVREVNAGAAAAFQYLDQAAAHREAEAALREAAGERIVLAM